MWGKDWEERIGGMDKVKRLREINKEAEKREQEVKHHHHSNNNTATTIISTPRYKQVLGSPLPNQHKQDTSITASSTSEDGNEDSYYSECDTLLPADIIGML